MMSAKNEIENGLLSLSFEEANNLGTADAAQNETFATMAAMYAGLRAADDPRRTQMAPLFTMDADTARETLSAIGANMAVKSMAAAQRSEAAGRVLSSRLSETGTNDFWAKFGKSWGHLRHGTDAHSSTALLGWDRKVSPRWRFGVFAEYGRTSLSDKTAGSEVREQRFGLYADHVRGGNETMLYVDYGWMRTKLHRSIPTLGLKADATYHSQILELGGEYRYDLHAGTDSPWHVRPFVKARLSRLWQNGYRESGAGVFAHEARNAHNDYFAVGAGVEFRRSTKHGDLAVRLGLRHAFAGAEPKMRFNYAGDGANACDLREAQDKTHFVCSLGGEASFARGWTVAGEAGLTRGAHDKEWSCALTVRKSW
ncbi:MAG: autotransporter outer membrane beta-barrel domain-containing protein, partial [Pyramidobacter sp.]|nr:autotransporter outer membrane beta-barrel domain-containing protein [Pyramidobacter sp.]